MVNCIVDLLLALFIRLRLSHIQKGTYYVQIYDKYCLKYYVDIYVFALDARQ
jgi:hypothetical protein